MRPPIQPAGGALAASLLLLVACGGAGDAGTPGDTAAASGAATESGTAAAPDSACRVLTSVAADSMTATGSGLRYLQVEEGEGRAAASGDTAAVHYTGCLTDGTKFDASRDRGRPIRFPLGVGKVIEGWDEGVAGMKPGGVRILRIPPQLAYGSRGGGPIPPNATLLFRVELMEVAPSGDGGGGEG